jgi:hypothetical protein
MLARYHWSAEQVPLDLSWPTLFAYVNSQVGYWLTISTGTRALCLSVIFPSESSLFLLHFDSVHDCCSTRGNQVVEGSCYSAPRANKSNSWFRRQRSERWFFCVASECGNQVRSRSGNNLLDNRDRSIHNHAVLAKRLGLHWRDGHGLTRLGVSASHAIYHTSASWRAYHWLWWTGHRRSLVWSDECRRGACFPGHWSCTHWLGVRADSEICPYYGLFCNFCVPCGFFSTARKGESSLNEKSHRELFHHATHRSMKTDNYHKVNLEY